MLPRSGEKVPRPLANTLYASQPNEVLHFDYLYLRDGQNETSYVLVVKDDFSGYIWLCETNRANAAHAAEVLSRLHSDFRAPPYWVSYLAVHLVMFLFGDHSS